MGAQREYHRAWLSPDGTVYACGGIPDAWSAANPVHASSEQFFLGPVGIDSITPPSGSFAGGTVVQIQGSGFTIGADTAVPLGGIPATGVSVASPTPLSGVVPAPYVRSGVPCGWTSR